LHYNKLKLHADERKMFFFAVVRFSQCFTDGSIANKLAPEVMFSGAGAKKSKLNEFCLLSET
jgi:hypothetical protein